MRYTFDNRWFSDTYEGLPGRRLHRLADEDGRPPEHRGAARAPTSSTSRDEFKGKVPIVYTGPVDEYFGNSEGGCRWRTVDLEREVEDVDDFQGTR